VFLKGKFRWIDPEKMSKLNISTPISLKVSILTGMAVYPLPDCPRCGQKLHLWFEQSKDGEHAHGRVSHTGTDSAICHGSKLEKKVPGMVERSNEEMFARRGIKIKDNKNT